MTRTGIGCDFHRLVPGRRFVLAGVPIPCARGPLGHSDGDPLCHAVADALLGAAGCGDIGEHFPDHDPSFKDLPGLEIIARTLAITAARGLRPRQIDAVVVCQAPKLAPFRAGITANLARALGVAADMVNVKFKTTEGLGDIGRSRALSAWAVATLENVT